MMDCKICNPETDDFSACLKCQYELEPVLRWMGELTGNEAWPIESLIDFQESRIDLRSINSFFAGARQPFELVGYPFFKNRKQVMRLGSPLYNYILPSEVGRS